MNLARILKSRQRSLSVYEGLMEIDAKLVKAGFPPMSPLWKKHLKAFYESGKVRFIARIGRRGGKSSTICRVAVAELLYGKHQVTPGDIGIFVIVSVIKKEAKQRLTMIKEILKVLGVQFISRDLEIQLKGAPLMFRVYPANFRSSVGMTCIGWVGDEMSRWRDDSESSNPASDIIASIRPAMATMINAHEFYISSPWARSDAHYQYVEKGITEEQHVVIATTWEANPTLSINRCRQLEPDEPTFDREYRAIPMDNDARQFFDEAALREAVDKLLVLPREIRIGEEAVAGGDFAFTSDFSACVIHHISDGIYYTADIDVLKPRPNKPLVPSHVCARFASRLLRNGIRGLMADHHYQEAISEHLGKKKIAFMKAPKSPAKAYIRARTLFNQGLVRIPDDETLIRSFLDIKGRPTPSGNISIQLPRREGGGHADIISAFVLSLYQRRGQVCKNPYNGGLPPGWTREEVEEVAEIEREMKKNSIGEIPFITRRDF